MAVNRRRTRADRTPVVPGLARARRLRARRDDGFSMVEMIVALVVIAIVATASIGFFLNNIRGVNNQRQHQEAVYLADQQLQNVESLPVAKLVQGRTQTEVTALYSTPAATALKVVGQDDTTNSGNWDTTASAPGSEVVPLSETQTVNHVPYTLTTFIDVCWYANSSGICGPTKTSKTDEEYRVSIYETWSGPGSCSKGCNYTTSTLIDPTADPTFDSNISQPTGTLTTPASGQVNNDNTYTDTCSTGAGSSTGTLMKITNATNLVSGLTVEISSGGGSIADTYLNGTSEIDFCLISSDSPGTYTITVLNPDGGHFQVSVTEIPSITKASGWTGTGSTLTLYGGALESGATLSTTSGSASWTAYQVYNCSTSTSSPCSASGSLDEIVISGFSGPSNGGTATLKVSNPDSSNATYTITAPKAGTWSKTAVPVNQTTTISITGASNFKSTLGLVKTAGSGTASVAYGSASTATVTVSPTATGTMSVYLYNDDGGTTATINLTVDPLPVVTSETPNAIAVSTSKTVTVAGSNFVSGLTATSTNGTVSVGTVTSTSVVLTVRGSSVGTDTLTLTNPDGGKVSFNLTIDPLPTISRISPTSARHSTNQTFTVTGTNFNAGATLTVTYAGNAVGVTATVVNSTTITFPLTLNSTQGTVSLKVAVNNTDGGTSSTFSQNISQS